MGQAGAYIIQDPAEDALGLPSGYGEFDIPIILASKQYNRDGTLFSPKGETDSLWGDIIEVVSDLILAPLVVASNDHSPTSTRLTVLERTTMAILQCRAKKIPPSFPKRRNI